MNRNTLRSASDSLQMEKRNGKGYANGTKARSNDYDLAGGIQGMGSRNTSLERARRG